MEIYRSLTRLGQLIADIPWPVDFFSPEDLPTFLDHIYVQDYQFEITATGFFTTFWLAFEDELSVSLPGLEGVKLVVGGDVPGFTFVNATLIIGDESSLTLNNISLALRFDPSILKPAALNPGDPIPDFVEIQVTGSIRISSSFDVDIEGFDAFKLTPAMIGDSGIIISADDVKLDLSRTSTLPEIAAAGFDESFMGIYIGEAKIQLPKDWPAIAPEHLVLHKCAFGSGGISGELGADYTPKYDPASKTYSGSGGGELFGIPFGLKQVDVQFKQNALQRSMLTGELLLPFFEKRCNVELGLSLDGGFALKLIGVVDPSDSFQGGLLTLTKPGILSLTVESLGLEVTQGTFLAKLSGQVTPLFGKDEGLLDWPSFKVKELVIDSKGNVHLQGGWLNLPNQYHLNFYGFTMEIDKLGFGNTSDGGRWMGFSGAITLVSGMPAGASVEGLRLTWYEDVSKTQISLNGVGIAFSVPNVLNFEGSVSYDSSLKKFQGGLTLNLISLDMEVDGKAVFEEKDGQTFFALYLAAEWPAGIPLWSTGLGLYGIQGLFALGMEPKKLAGEEWYGVGETGWYHREERGVINLEKKWKEQPGALALGAGVTLGTIADNGHAFSGSMLLVIVFPGPVLLIEGTASLLQDRAKLDKEANFRALVVLDAKAGTFTAGLDARYQYDNAGRLIDIHGSAKAFFNFNDASAWYLDLGERDPDKRIQAKIFQLFEADSYVMLDAHQLAMGARIGYNNHWGFGPLRVTLEAWLESNAVVNWHPVHFYGDLHLYGRLVLSAFHFSVGLTAEAYLLAEVFDPFHLKGQVSGRLKLPWPLHSISRTVTLEWGPRPTVPALPTPLLEVAIEHLKTTTSWPLPQRKFLLPADAPPPSPEEIPVVPLDSRPHVTFSRPVNDDALVGVNAQPLVPERERIGDPSQNQGPLSVRYGLSQVTLEKQSESTWQVVAQKPRSEGVPDMLYGSWAPLPRMPDGGGQNLGQTKLWLWSKSAFDYTRSTGRAWNEWFTNRYSSYPCLPPVETCWDFEQVAPTASLPNPWQHPEHPGLIFSCEAFDSMSIIELSQPVEGLTHAFCVNGLLNATITLPEPTNIVKIPVLDSFPSYALFYGYDAQENVYGPFSRSSEQAIVEIRGGNMTEIGITTSAVPLVNKDDVYNVMGCAYVAQRNQLLFVESEVWGDGGRGSRLTAIDLNTNSYSVLGITHDILADIVVTADGTTAYLTAGGELLSLDLTKPNPDLSSATLVCSGLGDPQQIALDEAKSTAYVVDYYFGRLLRIDLGSRKYVPIFEHLQWPRGLLLASDGSTAYISEQEQSYTSPDTSSGWVSRVRFSADSNPTHDILYDGLTMPAFMRWANADQTQILLPLRDPANRLVMLDLSSVSKTDLVGVPTNPSSLALLPDHRLVVCSNEVISAYSTQLCLPQVCMVTSDVLIKHLEDELARWSQESYVLEPYTTYRLKITTTLEARGEGELNGYSRTETFTDCAYFRTGSPPALQVLSTPKGSPTASPFLSGLEDLGRYVSQAAAIPDASTPGAYKLGIEFNENYVDQLYAKSQRDLVIHLYDNNGLARDANGHLITLANLWGRVDQLTLTEREISYLAVLSQSGCALIDPKEIMLNRKLLSSTGSQILAPQTLYEARLVPMLYRENFGSSSFTNSLGSWQAQDLSGTSQWQSISDGTPPAPHVIQTTDATSMLIWTPNQLEDWSDYQLNVSLRAPTSNPIGVVFRYTNSDQYYLFSLEPQSDPTLPPHWRLLKKVAGQETPYVLAKDFDFTTDTDYLITVEALGSTVRVYQKILGQGRQLLFTITDPNPALRNGSIGLYCANNPGARFTDVRVEDFRATAPVAYRFTFTTS